MKEIDMGGFENQEVTLKFAGKNYIIEIDPPIELYRQYIKIMSKGKLESDKDWESIKDFIVELVAHNNDIDKKGFKSSLSKFAVANFLNAYNDLILGVTGGSKKVKKKKGKKK